jgi:hypothetical protein
MSWIIMATTHPADARPSKVIMEQLALSLGGTSLVRHQRELLYRVSPDLYPAPPAGDPHATRAAAYLGQAINEIFLSRQDTNDCADATRAPKSALQYFTTKRCARLMTGCGVAAEGDLPEMWRLLPQYEKRNV